MIPSRYVLAPRLSPAEERVLRAILTGHTTYQSLARAVQLSQATVRVHMYNIRHKCNCVNMADVVLWAVRAGYELPALDESNECCNERNPN